MGLLEVVDAGVATAEEDFAKLVEQRRRGRRDAAVPHRHAQDRLGAARLHFESRRILAQQFCKRYAVNAGHLRRVRNEFPGTTAPDHHRRHHETGAGGEVVEASEYRGGRQFEADLLGELAQGAHLRRLAGVESTTRQGPLPGVPAQVARPPGKDERGFRAPLAVLGESIEIRTETLLDDGQGHGGVVMIVDLVAAHGERLEPALEQLPQGGTADEIRFVAHDTFANRRTDASIAGMRTQPMPAATYELTAARTRIDAVLARHAPLWRCNPFREPEPGWLTAHPELAAAVLNLAAPDLDRLEQDDGDLSELFAPLLPEVMAALAAAEPPSAAGTVPCDRFAGRHVPGRKWAQIRHFVAALPVGRSLAIDWCAGKGHLGRTVAALHERPVRCLERNPRLCDEGARLAAGLPLSFHCCDVLVDDPAVEPTATVMALHACGALHERLLAHALESRVASLALSPCCYHLTPAWKPLSAAGRALELDQDSLHLAVQDMVTAAASIRRARLTERAFRAGYDALQRELRGEDEYLPQPSLRGADRRLGFAAFCARLAAHHGLELPPERELMHWLRLGWARDARCRRLELVRHAFRRLLELRIVLDRAEALADAGYDVALRRFCARGVTPRNLLLTATH